MALSTRRKNRIIADWKTGGFTKSQLEKKYKITFKTVQKLVSGISAENADTVEVLSYAEGVRKSIKNPVELKAVENVVKDRLRVHDITNNILDGMEKLVKGGKAQKVVMESMGESGSSATIIEHDLQADDYKKLQEGVDKASLTLGVNARFSQGVNIQNNNQNNQKNTLKVEWID